MFATSFFHVLLVEPETSMDDKVGTDQDWAVTFSWAWCWSWCVWLWPGHNFQVEHIYVVEEVCTVPASEDDHLCSADQVGAVIESGWWCATTLRSLIPCHRDWIQRVQISKNLFSTFSSENNNSATGQHRRVPISGRRWSSWYFWLNPPRWINVQNIGVIQVLETRFLAFVVMPTKDDKRGACKSSWMSSSGRWRNTFDLWESPEPLSLNYKT